MKRRTIAAVLAFLQLLLLTACGEGEDGKETTPQNTPDSADTSVTENAENALEALVSKDYEGYSFRMLGDTNSDWWIISLDASETTGEIINDTVYKRKIYVEDLLKVKITNEETTTATDQIANSVMADTDDYDQVWERFKFFFPSVEAGHLLDLHSFDAFSFDSPWWDQNALEAFSFNGRVFFGCNDTNVHTMEGCSAMYFSKTIVDQNNLDNPYTLVRENKWTLDKMGEMMRVVANDTNGDGTRNEGDTFGLVTGIGQYLSLVNGAGVQLVYLDNSSGETSFVLNTASEQLISTTEKVANMVNDKNLTVIVNDDGWGYNTFYTDHALFYIMQLGSAGEQLRENMENDFGVLPFPMNDETQGYYTTSMEATAQAMGIPKTAASNREVIGDVIEAMAIYSDAYLTDAYYETTLQGQIARDKDTIEMLDILTGNRTFDYSTCYGSWNVYNTYLASVQANGAEQLVSMTEGLQDSFNANAAATIQALRELE